MRRRVDIKAILANPESRRSLLRRSMTFLIGVGADFRISHAEATKRVLIHFNESVDVALEAKKKEQAPQGTTQNGQERKGCNCAAAPEHKELEL